LSRLDSAQFLNFFCKYENLQSTIVSIHLGLAWKYCAIIHFQLLHNARASLFIGCRFQNPNLSRVYTYIHMFIKMKIGNFFNYNV
jgi:hypothetical protein